MILTGHDVDLIDTRERWEELTSLFADCVGGRGGVALISGPVGFGKTELLQAFAVFAAAAGALVLTAIAARDEQALSFGLITQLVHNPQLSRATAQRLAGLLEQIDVDAGADAGDRRRPTSPAVLYALCVELLKLSEQAPLVIVVDDIHDADPASLRCLAYLIRRVSSARVAIVLAERDQLIQPYPAFHAELLHHPRFRRIALEPMSPAAVDEVVRRNDRDTGSAEHFALTGGNPSLLRALLEDDRAADPDERDLPGDAYAQAVLSCLYRCDPLIRRVGRTLAVFGDAVRPAVLGRLLDIDIEDAARALDLLGRAGLLLDGGFRHPRACAAVRASIPPEERTILHRQIAQLLHTENSPARMVAQHLMHAGGVREPWAVTTLLEAAEQALAVGEIDPAVAWLRSARRLFADHSQAMEVTAMLARAEWRLSPAAVLRYLPELDAAARGGDLTGRYAVAPVTYLLWHGRVDEAVALVTALCAGEHLDAPMARDLSVVAMWLAHSFPDRTEAIGPQWRKLARVKGLPVGDTPELSAATLLTAMASPGGLLGATTPAEMVLQHVHLDDHLVAPVCAVISALVLADRLDVADTWCTRFLSEATVRRSPTWLALLSGTKAEICLRNGSLADASEYAHRALTIVAPKAWGVAVGGPLSIAILAATAAGRYDEAASWLSVPLPPGMANTTFWPKYLHARGTYFLATGWARSALSDFVACGEKLSAWALDLPALVPWRTDLALAHLAMGRRGWARELAGQQLEVVPPEHARTRGLSLRVLAQASDPDQRAGLLRAAVELLRRSGDRWELGRALAELGGAQRPVGGGAQVALRGVQRLGGEYQFTPPEARSAPALSATRVSGHPSMVFAAELSDAERRVAALASSGHTNREIARKLYITISTVEQHLTRVYRKLNVNRRTDLPSDLDLGVDDKV